MIFHQNDGFSCGYCLEPTELPTYPSGTFPGWTQITSKKVYFQFLEENDDNGSPTLASSYPHNLSGEIHILP
jgi:hypothetical protein